MFNRSLALKIYPFDTRLTAMPPPTAGVFDYPTVQICLNTEWASHIMGAIERLAWEDAWEGDDETIYLAIQGVENILASFSIGGGCCCLPPGTLTRVSEDGVLQVSNDGGETWADAPGLDPRLTSMQFPPLPEGIEDQACAGAMNARDQLESFVDQVADVMDAGGTFTALVGAAFAIVSIYLSGGALAPLVVPLMGAFVSAGASSIRAAFDEDALDDFKCCVLANIAEDASFTTVADLLTCIASEMTGLAGTIAYAIVQLHGAVGMTNWARTGSADGEDCEDCLCEPTDASYHFSTSDGLWEYEFTYSDTGQGAYASLGYPTGSGRGSYVRFNVPYTNDDQVIDSIEVGWTAGGTGSYNMHLEIGSFTQDFVIPTDIPTIVSGIGVRADQIILTSTGGDGHRGVLDIRVITDC